MCFLSTATTAERTFSKSIMSDKCLQTPETIAVDLLNNNVCKICVLRFLGEKNSNYYKDVENFFSKFLGEECDRSDSPSAKQRKPNPCTVCLGLLQLSDKHEIIEKIVDAVNSSGYDSDDVTFALSLPIVFQLRNHCLWMYVLDKYFEYYHEKMSHFNISGLLKQDLSVVSVKEAWKWLCAQNIADRLDKSVNDGVNGNFHVNINIDYDKDAEETACLVSMHPAVFSGRSVQKRKFHGEVLTRKSVDLILQDTGLQKLEEYCSVPPAVPPSAAICSSVECNHDSLFLAGRYNKFSRSLSQTPWVIQGQRRMESSVEELISAPVSQFVQNDGIKFSSSGREDVDVRTLGKGRPFFLDVGNPRKTKLSREMLRDLESTINGTTRDIFVRDLQVVRKEELGHIKMGEESKTKTYSALCFVRLREGEEGKALEGKVRGVNQLPSLVLQQKTPIRVLHRRPLAVRPRTVFWMEAEPLRCEGESLLFKLRLQVQAGTYIKEFIHGDFGRTAPCLKDILERDTDIIALDVEEVALDWPPSIDYSATESSEKENGKNVENKVD